MVYLAYGMTWAATAIATSVGLYYTKNADCLWAMLIPAMISLKPSSNKNKKKEINKE
jgi:hypothetical protein